MIPAQDDEASDIAEDRAAWSDLVRSIGKTIGRDAPLEQFLQELAIRSKEAPVGSNTVTLMTIHGAKGKEFDHVYVVGLAEDILPSFQSLKAGENSAEMEEERRNCFVAITRARVALPLLCRQLSGMEQATVTFSTRDGFRVARSTSAMKL